MSKKQVPEKLIIAIKVLAEIMPKIIKFFQSSEWRGRFRKKTDERLDQLEIQVQQLTEAVKQLNDIVEDLVADTYEKHTDGEVD